MEGKCGKGSRVLIKLLLHLGYDAARITLYGDDLSYSKSHTLVSVVIDGEEMFIDSINTTEEFNRFINSSIINTTSFNLKRYGDRSKDLSTSSDMISEKFIVYNYGFPLAKIFNKLGFDLHIFNLKRPSKTLSTLFESVYLLKSLVNLLVLLSLLFFLSRNFRISLREISRVLSNFGRE